MARHDHHLSKSEKAKGTPGETAAPAGAKPVPLPVNAEGIPAELRNTTRWVAWEYGIQETKKGQKWTKVPINPKTGRSAKVNDPSTWGTFEQAMECGRRRGLDGVGLVITSDDDVVALDLDGCVDPSDRCIDSEASEIIKKLGSYAEFSPSGTGVRVYLRARGYSLPDKGKAVFPAAWPSSAPDKQPQVEAFVSTGYVTATGVPVPAAPAVIAERRAEFEALIARLEGDKKKRPPSMPTAPTPPPCRGGRSPGWNNDRPWEQDDQTLIDHALETDRQFAAVWNGDDTAHDGDASRGDMSILSTLWRRCNGDRQRVEQIARLSGRVRTKWDDRRGSGTYISYTLDKIATSPPQPWTPAGPCPVLGRLPAIEAGDVELRPGRPKETAGGTIKLAIAVWRGGKQVDEVQLSSTLTGRDKARKALEKHLPPGHDSETLLTNMIVKAREGLAEAREAGPSGNTVKGAISEGVPRRLGVAFRTPKGVWSEQRGAEMDRAAFTNHIPEWLLGLTGGRNDAAPGRGDLVRQLWLELAVLYADLMESLPEEVDCTTLGADSRRAEQLRQAIVTVWTATLTMERTHSAGGHGEVTAARTTLARRVLNARGKIPDETGEWHAVQPGFDAYWTVRVTESGEVRTVLAMLARLGHQIDETLPGVSSDEELITIGTRYGAFAAQPPMRACLSDGRPLAVLTEELARSILATADGESAVPPQDGGGDAS